MNREIKFRAWDKKSKKIREVNFIAFHNKRDAFSFNPSNTPKVIHLWGRDMIEQKDIILHREENDVILMQFTGLKDKNEVEIYEGDICKVTYFNHSSPNSVIIQEVTFNNGTFELKAKNNLGLQLEDSRLYVPLYWSLVPNKIEVIGNIYENPELLKK